MRLLAFLFVLASSAHAGELRYGDNPSGVVVDINGKDITPATVTASTITDTNLATNAVVFNRAGVLTAVSTFSYLVNGNIGLSTAAPVWPLTVLRSQGETGVDNEGTSSGLENIGTIWGQSGRGAEFTLRSSTDSASQNGATGTNLKIESIANAPANFIFFRISSGTFSGRTVVNSADRSAGTIIWQAWNGSAYANIGRISVPSQGTPGSSSNYPTYMRFDTVSSGTFSGAEKMRLSSFGGLAVNTAVAPTAQLDVKMSADPDSTAFALKVSSQNATSLMSLTAAGDMSLSGSTFTVGGASFTVTGGSVTIAYALGIGNTPSPAFLLDITGTAAKIGKARIRGTNGSLPALTVGLTDLGSADWSLVNTGGDLTVNLGAAANAITIKNTTGNVGIGTTIPTAKLHVSSGAVFDGNVGVTISTALFVGTEVSTQTAGGAGASVTVLCRTAGTFAKSGGCSCAGGVALTSTISIPNCVTAGCIPNGWTCQDAGGTGGACSAYVICGREQ